MEKALILTSGLVRRGGSSLFNYVIDEELVLKLLMPEHARLMFPLVERSRERLRQWLPWVDGVTEQAHIDTFVKNAVRQGSENGGFTAGLWVREEFAGIIGYHEIDWQNRSAGIGYWLGEGYEGKGYMTSACRVFVDYALLEMELNRIEIRCATGNLSSRAIPERLGFIFEGVIRQAEKLPAGYVNHAVYGLLRSEWQLLA
jgi:ribosomal-protein-serine acetyltransferase